MVEHPLTQVLLMILHYVLYFGLLLLRLNFWQIVLFMILHYMLYGFYLGAVFAPNHKGMPVLDKDSPMDFLHQQILTSRNVKAHPLIDFVYGGLNYQIEHHLFPNMPRNRLREAQRIVKAFCNERSIPYYETNILQSYREILHFLHEVSAPLRAADREETKKENNVETVFF